LVPLHFGEYCWGHGNSNNQLQDSCEMSGTKQSVTKKHDTSTPSDDVWFPNRVVCSPNGRTAAYVVDTTRAGASENAGIWVGSIGATPAKLTDDVPSTNLAITFGHDAESNDVVLAYAISREGKSEVVIRRLGQESQLRHQLEGTAEIVNWASCGALLLLLAEPGADTASLTSGTPLSDGAPLARSNRNPVGWRRIWHLDIESGVMTALSPEALTVWEFEPLDDGRVVAVASGDPSEAGWYHSVLTLLGPTPSSRDDLYVATWQISSPTANPDGSRIAFLDGWTSDRGLGTGSIRIVQVSTGVVSEIDLEHDVDVTWLRWMPDSQLWFAGWQGLGMTWGWIEWSSATEYSAHVHHESVSLVNSPWRPEVVPMPDGRSLSVRSSITEPPEVSIISFTADAVRWSTLNEMFAHQREFSVQEVRWRTGGVELEGLLALPREQVGPLPLVVNIHGGPTLSYHHTWELPWAETVTGLGYALFLPNPHGGPGRGKDFARMNLGDPGGVEFDQILAGVRHLASVGLVDLDRVAAMGASYGGYLTAWAIARGVLFRGGVAIASFCNLQSCWGTANNAPFYEFLCLGSPSEQQDLYTERSPVNVVSKKSLPTLILHGELDQCVSVSQARELFTALSNVGVAAELVVYPGEGHQTKRIEHVRDQRRRIATFLAQIFEH
jgi:dipeptidyl aminopeptidase/acylaminoacyl peptidase